MGGLKKFTEVLAGILEVGNWVALGFMVALFILTLVPGDLYASILYHANPNDIALNAYGFEIVVATETGFFYMVPVRIFSIGALFIFGLMAMVFRNMRLIIKISRGEGKDSQGATPFQGDVTRMVREIGIFLLAIVIVTMIFSAIASAIIGYAAVESRLNVEMLLLGLLMICLSSAFAQGEVLQQDVDGLV